MLSNFPTQYREVRGAVGGEINFRSEAGNEFRVSEYVFDVGLVKRGHLCVEGEARRH